MFGGLHSSKRWPPGSHVVCWLKRVCVAYTATTATVGIVCWLWYGSFEYFRTQRPEWEQQCLLELSYTDRRGTSKLVSLFGLLRKAFLVAEAQFYRRNVVKEGERQAHGLTFPGGFGRWWWWLYCFLQRMIPPVCKICSRLRLWDKRKADVPSES